MLLYLEIRSLQRSLSQSQDEIILDLGLVSLKEKGEGDLTYRHRETWGESQGKMEAETAMKQPQTKGHQGLGAATSRQERSLDQILTHSF